MINRAAEKIRSALLWTAGNVSLYAFAAFFVTGILCMEPMVWYRTQIDLINQYVIFPWGMALCLLRLEKRAGMAQKPLRKDIAVLFVLLLWIIVPFMLRFGITFNNMGAWYNHAVVYFGIYAFLSETQAEKREKLFDLFLLLCGVLSLVLGALLLYCAATASTFYHGAQSIGFGLYWDAYLCHGVHYNMTGMLTLCLAMLCLAGASRARMLVLRAMYGVSAVMMMLVVVLTQSRTARYSLLVVLAIGVYGVMLGRVKITRRVLHQAAAMAAAAAVLVGGYAGAAALTDAALANYSRLQKERYDASLREYRLYIDERLEDESLAEDAQERAQLLEQREKIDVYFGVIEEVELPADAQKNEAAQNDEDAQQPKARAAVDSTLSGRTQVWKNLFELWKENPKHFLIGNGVGRTGSRVVQGTIHESVGAVQLHNTYLQHTADFGLIGTLLLAAFFVLLIKPLLGVFFARGERRAPGYTALCMLVIAMLMTGMMESAPLGGLSPANILLFFSLALLSGRARDLALL